MVRRSVERSGTCVGLCVGQSMTRDPAEPGKPREEQEREQERPKVTGVEPEGCAKLRRDGLL